MKNSAHIYFVGFFSVVCVSYLLFSPSFHMRMGNIFFGGVSSLYNVELAEFFFERAAQPFIGKAPPYAYHQLSRTRFIKGNLYPALAYAEYEIELYPENLSTYYIIGLTLGYLNREEEAIEAFAKYIAYNPESWAARNDRAWLQFRVGDIDGALETIAPVTMYIENPWIQNTYGTLLMNKGKYEEARHAFENAQFIAEYMNDETWGHAYPGNDPRIYGVGLKAMRTSIENNLKQLNEMQSTD